MNTKICKKCSLEFDESEGSLIDNKFVCFVCQKTPEKPFIKLNEVINQNYDKRERETIMKLGFGYTISSSAKKS